MSHQVNLGYEQIAKYMSETLKPRESVLQEEALQTDAAPTVDLEAYFRRIGYTGNRTPTLDTLKAIHFHHAQAIPFENLNPFLRWPVRLDIKSIEQKLVHDGRGGYCFEQNLLLSQVLETVGFSMKRLSARILWNIPDGVITARGHMLLLVDIDQQLFVCDVGFGGLTLTTPLKLEPFVEQLTTHEPFRLVKVGEEFTMEAKLRGDWKPIYRFGLQEQLLPDYEVTSWYLCNHPQSHFIQGLIVARPTPQGRYVLRNNDFGVHTLDGNTERRTLSSVGELRRTLKEFFSLTLPESPEIDTVLQRVIDGTT